MTQPDELLKRLIEHLGNDTAYKVHGELETSPWGSGQWVKYTDPEGREHLLRVIVEPFRPE